MRTPATALLFAIALPAQGLQVSVPPENPLTPAKIVLGKMLFWEEQLSHDDTVACATCHQMETGGADPRTAFHPGYDGAYGTPDDVHGSPGVVRRLANGDFAPSPTFGLHVQVTGRLANPVVGAALHAELFWDGRASTTFVDPETNQVAIAIGGALESQAIGPILSQVEMGRDGRTWNDVRNKLQQVQPLRLASNLTPDMAAALLQSPTYPDLFRVAFGDPAITAQRIAFAIGSYERTLIPDQTPYDLYSLGNLNALTPTQQQGLSLFTGGGRCQQCHLLPLFSDDTTHNLGNRPWQEDPGRMQVTSIWADRGNFKTPSLRNVGLRRRGFHDGSMPALGQGAPNDPNSMVNFYFTGGGSFRDNVDPFLIDLSQNGVTLVDMALLEEFVRFGLTDPRVEFGLPPFDHPTLRSTALLGAQRSGQGVAGAQEPFFVDTAPAYPGNLDYQLGLAGGDGAGLALLTLGFAANTPPQWLGSLPLHVAMPMASTVHALQGPNGAAGFTTVRLPIPNLPQLANLTLYGQLFALDALAPLGIASSRGEAILIR